MNGMPFLTINISKVTQYLPCLATLFKQLNSFYHKKIFHTNKSDFHLLFWFKNFAMHSSKKFLHCNINALLARPFHTSFPSARCTLSCVVLAWQSILGTGPVPSDATCQGPNPEKPALFRKLRHPESLET